MVAKLLASKREEVITDIIKDSILTYSPSAMQVAEKIGRSAATAIIKADEIGKASDCIRQKRNEVERVRDEAHAHLDQQEFDLQAKCDHAAKSVHDSLDHDMPAYLICLICGKRIG